MKSPSYRLTLLVVISTLLASRVLASIAITFDTSNFTDASNLYVTFAAKSADLTYNPGGTQEQIIFNNNIITIDSVDYGTSKAYSLADIATNGLNLNTSDSLIGFISYGSKTNIEKLDPGTQPTFFDTATPRYSNFEISYSGSSGGADLTNISQFGGSLKMEFLAGATTQSYVANTLNTGDMFRALAATSGNSPTAIYTDSNKYFRAIGPNVFPASVDGKTEQNPYPSFNPYLENLYNGSSNGNDPVLTKITNLAPDQQPGGTGAAGFDSTASAVTSRVKADTLYNLDYHFEAHIEKIEAPSESSPNGTYQITLSGHVNATNPLSDTDPNDKHTYNNLSIVIHADQPADALLYMTNFIYQQSMTNTDGAISTVTSGWDDLITDFGTGTTQDALQYKVAGDFSQAILAGFVGSTIDHEGTAIGEMSTYEFWKELSQYAYGPAQPDEEFYSLWAQVVAENSEVFVNGETYDRLGVYGSPYDDRFDINLISPDGDTTEMRITLLPDGNLNVIPEPRTWALISGSMVLAIALFRRKRAA